MTSYHAEGVGKGYYGLHVVFEEGVDLAGGLKAVVKADGSIDLSLSQGAKICPIGIGSSVLGRTKTDKGMFGVRANGKLQLGYHSTNEPTCISGGTIPIVQKGRWRGEWRLDSPKLRGYPGQTGPGGDPGDDKQPCPIQCEEGED